MELLSYDCPFTGKRRVAGIGPVEKRQKKLGVLFRDVEPGVGEAC